MAALTLQPMLALPALALTGSGALSAENLKKLSSYEEVIWGLPKSGESTEARLDALEEKLFGKSKNGDEQARLTEVSRAISYGSLSTSGSGLQAIAPSLDKAPVQVAPFRDESYTSYQDESPVEDASTAALSSAMQLYQDGRVDEAKRALVALTNRDSKNFDALFNLGVIAEGQGATKEALDYYRRASALRPSDSEARQAVANLSNAQATADAAARASASQAAANANTDRLRKMVADASGYYRSGNYDGAVSLLEKVARETPNDADVQFALAQAYKGKGNTAAARSALNKAVALAPQNAIYSDALSQLNAPAGAPAYAPSAYNNAASYNNAAYAPNSSQSPEGTITPFSGSKADEFASGNYGSSYGNGGSNYSYSSTSSTSSTSSSTGTRLRRAVTYGLAGAAGSAMVTSMFGRNSYNNSRNVRNAAIGGAVVGGLLGLFMGR